MTFSVSGGPQTGALLYPGAAAVPLNLVFTNPHPAPITVTSVTVTVTGTSAAGCGAANFSVSQQLQATPTVPAGTTASLQDLGVAQSELAAAPDARRREPGRLPKRLGESRLRGNGDGMTAALLRMLGRRRRLLVVSAVVLVAGGLASGLLAYFSGAASAGSAGGAAATSVAAGTPPTSVSSQPGRAVTISWEATALANGLPVDGYLVTRYDANPPYAPQITLAGCGGIVTALSCTETAVPFGSWQYAITPVIGANWRGTESTKSGTVTIGAASLTLAQTTLGLAAFSGGSSPATLPDR